MMLSLQSFEQLGPGYNLYTAQKTSECTHRLDVPRLIVMACDKKHRGDVEVKLLAPKVSRLAELRGARLQMTVA